MRWDGSGTTPTTPPKKGRLVTRGNGKRRESPEDPHKIQRRGMWGYFVAGAPAVITDNVAQHTGLVNGTRDILHDSLAALSDAERLRNVRQNEADAAAEQAVATGDESMPSVSGAGAFACSFSPRHAHAIPCQPRSDTLAFASRVP